MLLLQQAAAANSTVIWLSKQCKHNWLSFLYLEVRLTANVLQHLQKQKIKYWATQQKYWTGNQQKYRVGQPSTSNTVPMCMMQQKNLFLKQKTFVLKQAHISTHGQYS